MTITDLRSHRTGGGHYFGSPIPIYPGDPVASAVEAQNEIIASVEQQSLVVGGQNNPLRIVYGRRIIGADICGIGDHNGNLVLICTWCEGEIDAIEQFWVNGQTPHPTIVGLARHYLGTPSQNPDSLAQLVFTKGLFHYQDSLPNIAYSVFEVPPGLCSGFPQITALIRGLKVASTSGGAKAYSQNPAYCIADFIENTRYGMARTVDWTSVAAVAAHAAETIGAPSEARHLFSLVIDSPQPVEQWLNVMRDYAECWVIPEGEGYRLILDSTGTAGSPQTILGISNSNPMRMYVSGHGYASGAIVRVDDVSGMTEANTRVGIVRVVNADHFDVAGVDSLGFAVWESGGTVTQIGTSAFSFGPSNIRSLSLGKRGVMDSPTIVDVDYTDASIFPWRTDTIDPVFVPGVYDNPPSVPFRRTSVVKTGLTRYSEAHRYAVQLLNAAQLDDLSVRFQAFDVALTLQAGDLIDVTYPIGLESKIMRISSIEAAEPGRWNIAATEHDDAKYSTEVVTGPPPSDSPLASPLNPPAVLGLTLSEVVTQTAGVFVSQISATWQDASWASNLGYPFVLEYRVDIFDGATLKETGTVQRTLEGATPPRYVSGVLPENRLYTVRVYTISRLSIASPPAEATITNSGKTALPSDVPSITGYEIGGVVFLNWIPATDLDLTGYWLKWGTTGSDWATATSIDRGFNGTHYETKTIPPGTWRIFIKALDSVRSVFYPWGQESLNATYVDIDVSSDAGAFLVTSGNFVSIPTPTNLDKVPGGWVTTTGATWDATFPSTMSSYTSPLWHYHASVSVSVVTEVIDVGAIVSGNWSASANVTVIDGSVTITMDLSTDNSSWTPYSGLTAKTSARYVRLSIASTGTSTIFIADAVGSFQLAAVTRSEGGFFTSSSSGAVAVTFASPFAKLQSIVVTSSGATQNHGAYDNATETGFDGYVLDATGTKVNGIEASWLATGV